MKSISLLPLILLFSMITHAQAVDKLGVKGPINFDNKSFNLAWASHPTANYYKQEYLQQGEDLQKFKTMILVEVATGAITAKDAFDGKVAELKAMSRANPFINYESSFDAAKNEYVLDFVITQNSADNKSAVIAERNVYRYKTLEGNKGVMLFAVSVRSYGSETKSFIEGLAKDRKVLVQKVKAFSLPAVKP